MEVKVQCSCGTRYKFDVEPVNNLMPGPISCPTCGADGTPASNAILQQSLNAQPTAVGTGAGQTSPAEKPRIRLHIPAPHAANPATAVAPTAPPAPHNPTVQSHAEGMASLAVSPVHERPQPRSVSVLAQPSPELARAKGRFGFGILGAVLGTLLSVGLWLGIF